MRSPGFITIFENGKTKSSPCAVFLAAARFCLCALLLTVPLSAQSVAVLTPEQSPQAETLTGKLENALAREFKVLDQDLSSAAFRASVFAKPFNLTLEEARNIGAAIGSDHFLLVKTAAIPRTSFKKTGYFEAYAAVYAVSSRTGNLVFWTLQSFEAETREAAREKLFDAAEKLAGEISAGLKKAERSAADPWPEMEELPAENSPAALNFRPPLPYRRVSPVYTEKASLYAVEATVDITVDFDEKGEILRTRIERWAGFGLDESVTETVRRMQWRPAERDKKTLPIRVLLRYNFRKLEKEQ